MRLEEDFVPWRVAQDAVEAWVLSHENFGKGDREVQGIEVVAEFASDDQARVVGDLSLVRGDRDRDLAESRGY